MPNHVKNFLTIKADGERLAEILDSIKDDEKGVGTIDFRKLIPLPQIQEVPESPFTQQGYAMYKQYVNEKTVQQLIADNDTIPDKLRENARLELRRIEARYSMLDNDEQNMFLAGKICYENKQKTGSTTQYRWNIANWGTKWNAYQAKGKENVMVFLTANSPPTPIMEALSKKYPEIELEHQWASDDFGKDMGIKQYLNGEVISAYLPENFSKEAYDMSFEMWDAVPEEHGYTFDEKTQNYISIPYEEDDEELEE